MPELEKFCTITGDLDMKVVGDTPSGMRIDFPFSGMATSHHWDGERSVNGIDYVTVRADGNMILDIHGVIGEKRESVGYKATGVSIANPDRSASPRELIVFETGNDDLSWLNNEVGIGLGSGGSGKINLDIYIVRD